MAVVGRQADGRPDGGVHPGSDRTGVHDAQTEAALPGGGRVGERFQQRVERPQRVIEARATHLEGTVEVARLERRVDAAGVGDALLQRDSNDAVAAHAHNERLRVGGSREQRVDGGVPHHRAEVAIKGAWRPSPLHVAQHRDAHLASEPGGERLPHALCRDREALSIRRPFGDHDDGVAAPGGAAGLERVDQGRLPVVPGRAFRDEQGVGAGGDRAHQREVAAMAPHHLDDEGALVARGGAADCVNRLGDPVQGRVGADGHVGAGGVVVDGADQADHGQPRVPGRHRRVHRARGHQVFEQPRPLAAEQIRAGERSVAAHDHQAVDAVVQHVAGGLEAAFPRAELLGPRRADHRAAAMDDAADIRPAKRPDLVAALDEAAIALVDPAHLEAVVEACPDNGPDCRVHARGVAAAGQDANLGDRHDVSRAANQRAEGLTSNFSWMTLANVCAINANPCWVGCSPSTPMYGFPPAGKAA